MLHSTFAKSAIAVMALWAFGISAPPKEKTGPCPTLARYTPTDKNWAAQNPAGFGGKITPPTSLYPSGTIQSPLSPDSSINCIVEQAGTKVQMVASERMTPGLNSTLPLAYIMEFTFDERGRTWAVEPRDYPYPHDSLGVPQGTAAPSNRATGGRGRILILTDTDGDGSLDNYKVFYTGFVIPTSVELVKGGVIAIVPPFIYFIPASTTNPDTAGGPPQVVVSNMGSSGTSYDAHGQTNSLNHGIDNWIYGHVGYNGCSSPRVHGIAGDSVNGPSCGDGAVWRFKAVMTGADTNLFQVFGNAGTNTTNAHGLGQTEDGQWMSSRATVNLHSLHSLRLGTTEINNQATNAGNTADHVFYPATRDYYAWEGSTSQMNNGFYSSQVSAVSGHDFYTATLLPSRFRRYSFQCEGMTHLCNQDSMYVLGSTWRGLRMPGPINSNVFSSTDAWTAPLKVRTGPDGALWVLDWYNYLFLHNPATPATNSAWNNALREKSRMRIYRIVPLSGQTDPVLNLSNASVSQLVQTLGHPNMFWRLMAQRLLIARAYTVPERNALLDTLQKVLENNKQLDTAFGTSPAVLHALWVVEGMKAYTFNSNPVRWDSVLKKLMLHPAWTVRRNVMMALPATAASTEAIKAQCAVNDPHPHVRIQALAALIRLPAGSTGASEMVATYHNTDSYSTAAFTAAGTKVTEITGTERPSSCPALAVAVGVTPSASRFTARRDVRFDVRAGGFTLLNNPQLGSGELVVRNLRGESVFRSTFNSSLGQWSNPVAKNLNMPVYFYTFRENNGGAFNGRIALAQF